MNRILRLCVFAIALLAFMLMYLLSPQRQVKATNIYYVDCGNSLGTSSDSNNGTTKTTAWIHAPGMTGAIMTYTHANGDRFIFHGGSTCPQAYLPWTFTNHGTSGNPDYYGVDTTWYSGTNSGHVTTSGTLVALISGEPFQDSNSSWVGGSITINGTGYAIASVQSPVLLTLTTSAGTQSNVAYSNSLFVRPIINEGGSMIGTNDNAIVMTGLSSAWVTFDNFEDTGHFWSGNAGFGNNTTIAANGGGDDGITVEHWYFHGWTHAAYSPNSTLNLYVTVLGYNGAVSPDNVYNDNVCSGAVADGGDGQSGTCGQNFAPTVTNNIHHDTPDLFDGSCEKVAGNIAYNTNDGYDFAQSGGTHGDAIFCALWGNSTNPMVIANNVVYNSTAGAEGPMFLEVGAQGAVNPVAYAYNNTVWMGDWGRAFSVSNGCFLGGGSGCPAVSTWTYHLWNNTVVQDATACPVTASGFPYSGQANVQCLQNPSGNNVTTLSCFILGANAAATPMGIVDMQNNHCISNYSGGTVYEISSGISVNSLTDLGNRLMSLSAAAADGYTIANQFQPISGSSLTVGQGQNLHTDCTAQPQLCFALVALVPSTNGTTRTNSDFDQGAYSFAASTNVTLSPSSEIYGSFNVGASSSPVTFTVTNNNATTATSITPTDTDSAEFVITNSGAGSCAAAGGSLATSASCTFTVKFSPTSAGAKTPTLSVSYSGGDGASPQTAALSGTGVATTAPAAAMMAKAIFPTNN